MTKPLNIGQTTFVNPSPLYDKEIEHYLERLGQLMTEDHIYLDPAMSLRLLAEKLEMQPNKL